MPTKKTAKTKKPAETAGSPATAKAALPEKPAPPQPALTPKTIPLPLTPDARIAYRTLALQYETAIQSTTDVGALEALNSSMLDVDNILTKDNIYRLQQTTALYDALLQQITSTNQDLKALQKQIAAIAGNFAFSADILSAIAAVLKIFP